MSRKPKHAGTITLSPQNLKPRVEKALREGRTQQALDLARQLHKHEPNPINLALLRQACIARAKQLRQNGQTRDARTVLENALQLGSADPAFLELICEELAGCGEARRALQLLERIPASPARERVLVQAVDSALSQGAAGRTLLPDHLQRPFDLVIQAFLHAEAGRDEQARDMLQGIGLQSPFLEWKLLIRGLLAYYQNDDVRAVENWQRLDLQRLAARVIAPVRFQIDQAFRGAQSPDGQAALQKLAERLQADAVAQALGQIRATLANPDRMAQAFRLAEALVPALKQRAPHLVPRLAATFSWAIVSHGAPDDVRRFQRLFGAPADDPQLTRLSALACEHVGELDEAHHYWQEFQGSIADHPTVWPGEQAKLARAFVLCRMGHNAARMEDSDDVEGLPPFLRGPQSGPSPLSPSAEECFRRAIELAPDQLELHEALFSHCQEADQARKAIKAALQLLKQFPDHVHTLTALGNLYMEQEEYAEALTQFERALEINPLDRSLRSKLGTAHTFHARAFAEAGRFDEARQEYEAALALKEGENGAVYCKWAACEFKAGETARAEGLLLKALAEEKHGLGVAYSMLIETIRMKLPRALKNRFDRDFNRGLGEPPTAAAALSLAVTAAAHKLAGVKYHGQKTHEKKVLAYLEKATKAEFMEAQLEQLCGSLVSLEAHKLLKAFTALGRQRFPMNPYFPFFEAEGCIALGPNRCPMWRVTELLSSAHELASALPHDDRQQALLQSIQARRDMFAMCSPFGGPPLEMMEEFFESFFGGDDERDWEDDDDEDW